MTVNLDRLLVQQETSARAKIKKYRQVADEMKAYLDKHPHEWGRYQSQLNIEVNAIFRDLMYFEKERLLAGDEESVYKLKNVFVKRLRKEYLHGDLIKKSLEKPYGYAGDFSIIDDIYRNEPKTLGFDRLFDNYFQMSAICHAVRNRKEDFKRIVLGFIRENQGKKLKIMDLASGPCRDVKEMLETGLCQNSDVEFHCYDQDERAFQHAKTILGKNAAKVRFIKENVVRIALRKDVEKQMTERYDVIFSTGLFDYLDQRVATRLVSNLRKLLNPGGIIAISDVRDKFSNPSIYYMEWVADWNLIYRSDDDYTQIFLDSGFKPGDLHHDSEQQGILQYIIAVKKS